MDGYGLGGESNGKPLLLEQQLVLRRRVYTQQLLEEKYAAPPKEGVTMTEKVKSAATCSRRKAWKVLTNYLPVIRFARHYQFRAYLLGDFLSGLTVSFMHLPQAMGFGILASLRPVHGLYSTFFPVLIYVLFGTSPYISFGTNAVMALLTQTVVDREEAIFKANYFLNQPNGTTIGPTEDELLAVKVSAAMACSFLVGVFLVGMGLLRLGFLTTYLSVTFVGGFTTAAAIHIASSQVPKMLGIKVKSFSGPGKLILMYIDLFKNITQIRWPEVSITVICVAVLLIVKICVNERYKAKMKMPVPIDLIVVIIGTLISYLANFDDSFGVKIVGPIPSGIPAPAAPDLSNASNFIADCFVMAILSLAMSISMAKLTAKMHGIAIDDNQELVAYGSANLFSGFFFSFPSATAPPRTMILSSLGAKTTLNGIPTAVFMLLVLLLIGQLFVSLPLSVLAAMIVVSMKDLLLQFRTLPRIWKVNKYDFVIWVTTCAVSVLVDLDFGIIAGVGISIILVVVQTQLATASVLGLSDNEDLVLDVEKNKSTTQLRGVKIFRFPTSLYYATAESFKSQVYKGVINPMRYKKQQQKLLMEKQVMAKKTSIHGGESKPTHSDTETSVSLTENGEKDILCQVIIDCSGIQYMDISGLNMLQQVIKEYGSIDISVHLAGCQRGVRGLLDRADFFDNFPRERLFHDVFDAVESLRGSTEKTNNGVITKI